MKNKDLFVDGHNLPNPLSKEEIYDLINKTKIGDNEAREILIKHNIKLVLYEVTNKFDNIDYDPKDLVSIGIIGLIKAINSFDTSKTIEFSTYALKCIDNEILLFCRHIRRHKHVDSLDKYITVDNKLTLKDVICDDYDFTEKYIQEDIYKIIREIIENLPAREREIIMLRFGFYNGKIYKMKEIGNKLSISRCYASMLVKKILQELSIELEKQGVIEKRSKTKINTKKH